MSESYIHSIEAQIIGRVFTYDGTIHFVLGTDTETGMARCSRRMAEGSGITYLPMADVHAVLIEQANPPPEAEPLDLASGC
jgi:hypothetical protein